MPTPAANPGRKKVNMKKVIDGALYNTDTANLLGEWDNNFSRNDFNYCEEALYLTKSGKYFLYGFGGGLSKYSVSVGNNSWSGGEKIQPMSPVAAREWAEKHLETEEFIKAFGEPEEASDTKVVLNISVSSGFKAMLIKAREETGKSISQIIEDKFAE